MIFHGHRGRWGWGRRPVLIREIGGNLYDSLLLVGMMEKLMHLALPLLIILEKGVQSGENAARNGEVDSEAYLCTGNLGGQAEKNGERCDEKDAGDCAKNKTDGIANELANDHGTSEKRGQRHGNNEDIYGKNRVADEAGMEPETIPLLLLSDPLTPDPRNEESKYGENQSDVQNLLLQLQAAKNTGEFFEHRTHYTKTVTFRPHKVIESGYEEAV